VMVVVEIAVFFLLIGLFVPPVVLELGGMVQALPDASELQDRIATVRARLSELPEPTQVLVRQGVDQVVGNLRANLSAYVQTAVQVAIVSIVGLFNTLGFVLGFFGIPTWLVAVLTDQRAGVRGVNRLLPESVRPDFWAIVTIMDRAFSAFVRGQVVVAFFVAVMTYVGLVALQRLAVPALQYPLILAVLAGLTQLIPTVGPIIGTLIAVALGLTLSPQTALSILALYAGVQVIQGRFIARHFEQSYLTTHPALFVIVLVVLAQFGFIWLLVAAPLTTVVRNLFVYIYGRLSEPPRPAGLLAGVGVPASTAFRPMSHNGTAHG
jgi:predicted PurR-regulated permease PerM